MHVLTKRAPTMFLPRLCQANTAPIVGEMRHSSCQTSRTGIEFILQWTSNTLYSSSFVNVKYSYTMNRSNQFNWLLLTPQGSDTFSSGVKVRAAKGKQCDEVKSFRAHVIRPRHPILSVFFSSTAAAGLVFGARPVKKRAERSTLGISLWPAEAWERSGWRRAGPGVFDIV